MTSCVVQISDPHVRVGHGDLGTARALAAAVEAIAGFDPAPVAVLLTGDLAEHGAPAEYARVRELLAPLAPLAVPVHPLPGNHDDRDALRAAFADHDAVARTQRFLQYAVACDAIRVLMCDTLVPGSDAGRLCDERLAWLEAELAAGPAVVAMHHPPVLVGIGVADAIGLPAGDRARLEEVCADGRVEAVVAGHVHRAVYGRLGATPVFVCPSVWMQGALDLRPDGGLELVAEPPGYAVHARLDGAPLVTHVQPLGR